MKDQFANRGSALLWKLFLFAVKSGDGERGFNFIEKIFGAETTTLSFRFSQKPRLLQKNWTYPCPWPRT